MRVCACVRVALQGACTYPNGPRSDLIRSGSKKVLQLQSCIASLDDPAQGTGGEKYGFERRGPNCFGLFITADGHEFTSAEGPIHPNINSLSEQDGSLLST